jgi:hypothetical protein
MEKSPARSRRLVFGVASLFLFAAVLWLITSRDTSPVSASTEGPTAGAAVPRRALLPVTPTAAQPDAGTARSGIALGTPLDVPTDAELAAGVAGKVGPGQVLVKRVTADEMRAQHGLPPVDPALVELEDLPPETRQQASDPDTHQLFVFDHDLAKARLLAEHEDLEGTRFGMDALSSPPGSQQRRLLERAAAEHAGLARSYQQRAQTLAEERAQLVTSLDSSQEQRK